MLDDAVRATPAGTRSFVYFGHVDESQQWKGVDLWAAFKARVPAGENVIPVVELSHIALPSPSLTAAIAHTGRQVALRLTADEMNASLAGRVATGLATLGVAARRAHIIVDLKNTPAAVSHSTLRSQLRSVGVYASVTVVAGVFPPDLTGYKPGVHSEARLEWEEWQREHTSTSSQERLLGYGDYTTQCALYAAQEPHAGTVSIRYTVDNAIVIFRGYKADTARGLGRDQIHGHCRLLIGRPDFDGARFSLGDHRFHSWATPSPHPGGPGDWRVASIVHHITHVVAQLHDPAGSSRTARQWARAQAVPSSPQPK